jgi:hypothetical protein
MAVDIVARGLALEALGQSSSSGYAPGDVTNLSATAGDAQIEIKWEDPNDVVVDGITLMEWSGTKLLRKAGAYPASETDGVLVVDNKTNDQYASTGIVDSGLTNDTVYYYQAFPYSTANKYNTNVENRVSATPTEAPAFVVYGVRIDNTNSNPETGVIYTDDAAGFIGGSTDWDSRFPFNTIRPCMLKAGVVQYYLDPIDYAKKADGSASDITSGTDGDAMIEIPKMAYSIKTVGNYTYVKVTNNTSPTNNVDGTEDWCFHAHTRSTAGDKNNLYVGAYLGWTDGSTKLRSLSGKAPTATQTIGTFRTRAQANGTGYDQIAFYPLTLLQSLFLVRYKNRDSQTALGRGFVDDNSAATNTGGANTRGLYYGEGTGKQQMKFAGIEDFWGNLYYWIDGLFSNTTRNMLTGFTSFNDTGSGYTDRGQGATSNIGNYMSVSQGTSSTGFIAKTISGSESTYFCDYAHLSASSLPIFGGRWASASSAGAFRLSVASAIGAFSDLGGRLMFL